MTCSSFMPRCSVVIVCYVTLLSTSFCFACLISKFCWLISSISVSHLLATWISNSQQCASVQRLNTSFFGVCVWLMVHWSICVMAIRYLFHCSSQATGNVPWLLSNRVTSNEATFRSNNACLCSHPSTHPRHPPIYVLYNDSPSTLPPIYTPSPSTNLCLQIYKCSDSPSVLYSVEDSGASPVYICVDVWS